MAWTWVRSLIRETTIHRTLNACPYYKTVNTIPVHAIKLRIDSNWKSPTLLPFTNPYFLRRLSASSHSSWGSSPLSRNLRQLEGPDSQINQPPRFTPRHPPQMKRRGDTTVDFFKQLLIITKKIFDK